MDPTYLATLRDSDGNDCTVYTLIIEASDRQGASDKAWKWIDAEWPDDEGDGGYGTFHPCDCVCDHQSLTPEEGGICDRCLDGWECSHGGLLMEETQDFEEYPNHDAALAQVPNYHQHIILP